MAHEVASGVTGAGQMRQQLDDGRRKTMGVAWAEWAEQRRWASAPLGCCEK
jgi:hypothetical protein